MKQMKVFIAGAGSVGRHMAEQLVASGHHVWLIDNDPNVVGERVDAGPIDGVTWLLGDACEVRFLEKAKLNEADVVAAVTGDDEDNLVVSLLAKQEFGVPRVVARVNNPSNEWMFNEMWGVDVSVSTPHLLTGLVEEAVTVGSLVQLMAFEGGRARLTEVTLASGSPAIGREIAQLVMPREAAVVAVVRGGHVVAPSNDLALQENDEVLVLLSGSPGDGSDDMVRAALVG